MEALSGVVFLKIEVARGKVKVRNQKRKYRFEPKSLLDFVAILKAVYCCVKINQDLIECNPW